LDLPEVDLDFTDPDSVGVAYAGDDRPRCARCARIMRDVRRSTRRYCSTTCRVAASRGEPFRDPDPIYCEWIDCDEVILSPRSGQHFCSARCRAAAWRMWGPTEQSHEDRDQERAEFYAGLLDTYANLRSGDAS
jgi:hypothetical protein